MRIKLIACEVFARLLYREAALSDNIIDLELLPMKAHNEPEFLNRLLQASIIRAEERGCYDRIILGYGICGNAIMGLTSTLPLVVPRMHDCCAMFLGSVKRCEEVFGQRPSTPWRVSGHFERWEEDGYTFPGCPSPEPFPEDAVYIGFQPVTGCNRLDSEQPRKSSSPPKGAETAVGDTSWLQRLAHGPWPQHEFLTLKPGKIIKPVYDMKEVLTQND